MNTIVKICGLKDAEHVKAAVIAGADAIGFVFADSVRRVTPVAAAVLSADIPSRVKRVAVMRHPTNDEWQEVLREFEPDVLQSDVKDFACLDVPDTVELWPVYREGCAEPESQHTFVYEGQNSGQGETVNWSRAASVAREGNMILAGGLAADNVAAAIATVRPYGVDVSSSVESSPGWKDARLINQFIEAVRAAEKDL